MTDKELRKLGRTELLELLLAQSQETERLQKELEETKQQLQSRELQIQEAGSIAEASLRLHNLFLNAQNAADQYLENIRRLSADQDAVLMQREKDSEARAQAIIAEAEATRDAMLRQAKEDSEHYWKQASAKLQELMEQDKAVREILAESLTQENIT